MKPQPRRLFAAVKICRLAKRRRKRFQVIYLSREAFEKFFTELVESEKLVIGPVATTIAERAGLVVSDKTASFSGNGKRIAELLVSKYHELEGPVAYTLAKKAVEKTREKFPGFSLPESVVQS